MDGDLVRLGLIDPDSAAQLDRLLQAAADAAKLNNRVAVRDDIKDLRKLLWEQYRDLDNEDQKDFDRDKDQGPSRRLRYGCQGGDWRFALAIDMRERKITRGTPA